MYERIVTAAFIAKNPSEGVPFGEDEAIKKWKLWQRIVELAPEAKTILSAEKIEQLKTQYTEANSKRKQFICSKCHQPKTRVDLAAMATKASPSPSEAFGQQPTFQTNRRI
jgi:hypothetical protein